DAREIRKLIGYASQEVGVDQDLTGRENIFLQCRFYHIPKDKARQKANALLRLSTSLATGESSGISE
ncbi:MAG: hypothetical protein ABR986_05415, partial [Methanomassiliicoccales archaeon]